MALMSSPELIVADEPTTALDVTVQAEVLRLLRRLNDTHGTALLLISHDIKVISALCDRVCVMYAGRIVELLSVEDLHHGRVYHPYTKALLAAVPKTAGENRNEPLIPLQAAHRSRVLPARAARSSPAARWQRSVARSLTPTCVTSTGTV